MPVTKHKPFEKVLQTAADRFLLPSVRRGVMSAKPVLDSADAGLRAAANVHSLGIGFKRTNGLTQNGTLALRFFVLQKLPGGQIPPEFKLPRDIEGFPTDVVESPIARNELAPLNRDAHCVGLATTAIRPLVSGLGIAPRNSYAHGTLSWFCSSNRPGEQDRKFVLSNWHVLANYGLHAPGASIFQPPGAGPTCEIGLLHRSVALLPHPQPNFVDAAIASLNGSAPFVPEVHGIGPIAPPMLAPAIGMAVEKVGCTSCRTVGVITDFPFLCTIGMPYGGVTSNYLFSDQARIVSSQPGVFSQGGDSGSIVLELNTKRPVALLFASEDNGPGAFASPIEEVCQALDITLL